MYSFLSEPGAKKPKLMKLDYSNIDTSKTDAGDSSGAGVPGSEPRAYRTCPQRFSVQVPARDNKVGGPGVCPPWLVQPRQERRMPKMMKVRIPSLRRVPSHPPKRLRSALRHTHHTLTRAPLSKSHETRQRNSHRESHPPKRGFYPPS
ncbi:hypothetical protein D3C71_1643370 [compost metagenome]